MRAFKTILFDKWAKKQHVEDESLVDGLEAIAAGNYDADLGGGLFKQRVALPGGGKRGGARVILAFKIGDKAFFLYGFKKGDQGNLTAREKKAYKIIAKTVLAYSELELSERLANGSLIEIGLTERR